MNSVSIYDPFADVFPTLFRGLFDQPASAPAAAGRPLAGFRVDVREGKEAYVVHADLPGTTKERIQVDIDGAQVTIRAEVKGQSEQKDGERVLRAERTVGQFARSFQLGTELDEERATAKYDNGVLELTLPKKQAPAARRIAIS